jgi:outer membrane receptor protein involved in Fe transport
MVVEGVVSTDLMSTVQMRLDSDQLINTLSAEEMSKFAASDVGDALKRVAGVNVVGGQFAVIRGLDDRYSSTLYNNAPIPSPDPSKQSIQLDLFPSDIVSNLQVAKTFGAASPSNSAGGSINIVTQDYPDELTFKVTTGSGFNERALD